jgi:hypothetical protein
MRSYIDTAMCKEGHWQVTCQCPSSATIFTGFPDPRRPVHPYWMAVHPRFSPMESAFHRRL